MGQLGFFDVEPQAEGSAKRRSAGNDCDDRAVGDPSARSEAALTKTSLAERSGTQATRRTQAL